jgi:hypothetical protein
VPRDQQRWIQSLRLTNNLQQFVNTIHGKYLLEPELKTVKKAGNPTENNPNDEEGETRKRKRTAKNSGAGVKAKRVLRKRNKEGSDAEESSEEVSSYVGSSASETDGEGFLVDGEGIAIQYLL